MKQQNRVITDINICKMRELFVHFLRYSLCTVFVTYFNPFFSEKCFFPLEINCSGQKPTILKKYIFIRKALLNGRDKMFNLTLGNMSEWLSKNTISLIFGRVRNTPLIYYLKIYQHQANTDSIWQVVFENFDKSLQYT